jgi:hypothetical protein
MRAFPARHSAASSAWSAFGPVGALHRHEAKVLAHRRAPDEEDVLVGRSDLDGCGVRGRVHSYSSLFVPGRRGSSRRGDCNGRQDTLIRGSDGIASPRGRLAPQLSGPAHNDRCAPETVTQLREE